MNERRIKVVQLLASGLTPKEIAISLEVSRYLIFKDLEHIRTALGGKTTIECVVIAASRGMVKLPR